MPATRQQVPDVTGARAERAADLTRQTGPAVQGVAHLLGRPAVLLEQVEHDVRVEVALRVRDGKPPVGVKDMLLNRGRPSRSALMLHPLPRCATTRRPPPRVSPPRVFPLRVSSTCWTDRP